MERQSEASLDGKVAIVTGSSRGIGKRRRWRSPGAARGWW